ncbi:hypothetical protein J6590_066694 [Homalodisca vitripennis]|nr:hypothetical protein J6590_066694 [Homalodisca vitripennis]
MGDINLDTVNSDTRTTKLNEKLAYHYIVRLNLPPTRIIPYSHVNRLDLFQHRQHKSDSKLFTQECQTTVQMCTLLTNLTEHIHSTRHRKFNERNLTELKALFQVKTWEDFIPWCF